MRIFRGWFGSQARKLMVRQGVGLFGQRQPQLAVLPMPPTLFKFFFIYVWLLVQWLPGEPYSVRLMTSRARLGRQPNQLIWGNVVKGCNKATPDHPAKSSRIPPKIWREWIRDNVSNATEKANCNTCLASPLRRSAQHGSAEGCF